MTSSNGWRNALLFLFLLSANCHASLQIAVASNFAPVMAKLLAAQPNVNAKISSASSGTLYAQITHGAPFDLFFSADSERPMKLEQSGVGFNRQTYALGRLVYWRPGEVCQTAQCLLRHQGRIAIANPKLAPYGRAAIEVLRAYGLEQASTVYGNNIAQAFGFVHSGNAPAGLVAKSQLLQLETKPLEYFLVPATQHNLIEQQVLVISKESKPAQHFLAFVMSSDGQRIIADAGYDLP